MAFQLFGFNGQVQLGPLNGPNEPVQPDPLLNPNVIDVFDDIDDSDSDDEHEIDNVHQPGPPNWRETELEPFRSNFYREHFRTAWRSTKEVKEYRERNHITIVKGHGAQKPLIHLYETNFPACLVEALEANNITSSPTPAQAQCWPVALKGRDLLAVLRRRTEDKTLAYILPAIVHVLHQPPLKPHQGFLALVLAPTPEDARRIQRMVGDLETHSRVRATCVCSGASKDRQLRDLSRGFEICVATPGRLHTFLKEGKLDAGRCTYLVLDEADRMVDMGFEQQLIDIANVGEIQALTDRSVEHVVYVTAESEKEARLVALLEDILCGKDEVTATKVIVFAETKKRVDDLVTNLRRRDWPVVGLHGGTTERARDWALAAFGEGKTPILVATDVATRQLPSDGVRYVVNYDYPSSAESYLTNQSHVAPNSRRGAGGGTPPASADPPRPSRILSITTPPSSSGGVCSRTQAAAANRLRVDDRWRAAGASERVGERRRAGDWLLCSSSVRAIGSLQGGVRSSSRGEYLRGVGKTLLPTRRFTAATIESSRR
ncbi:probable ATP-dependent RNA helicase DDX5 [Rhipicephalus sanguineus]|uniref:probable ATP-dependent RNA helicase DDX5 n=1 Tax=Rhipicephalus sanguineus TaxID=34632 RepID=UPI001892E0AF|nr:probable ATP-dependent RNA helicase DDX5 [Rhipicephalus sanguineus]